MGFLVDVPGLDVPSVVFRNPVVGDLFLDGCLIREFVFVIIGFSLNLLARNCKKL